MSVLEGSFCTLYLYLIRSVCPSYDQKAIVSIRFLCLLPFNMQNSQDCIINVQSEYYELQYHSNKQLRSVWTLFHQNILTGHSTKPLSPPVYSKHQTCLTLLAGGYKATLSSSRSSVACCTLVRPHHHQSCSSCMMSLEWSSVSEAITGAALLYLPSLCLCVCVGVCVCVCVCGQK